MSSHGVVSTLTAPVRKKVTQPDLIEFEAEYEACKEKVVDVNRNRDKSRQSNATCIYQCMERNLFHSLSILGQFGNAPELQDATDAAEKKYFE